MTQKTIRIIRKRVGEAAEYVDVEKTLERLQTEVDGFIQVIPLFSDILLVCNEDGNILGLPHNFTIAWRCEIVGNVFFVRNDVDGFGSCSEEDMKRLCDFLGFLEMGLPIY